MKRSLVPTLRPRAVLASRRPWKLPFERQFVLAGHALGMTGIAALATTHQVGVAYLVLALAALSWSVVREWRGHGWQVPPAAANTSMIAALLVVFLPVLPSLGGVSPIRAIAEFLLVLTALKFAAAKETRDWTQIYVLSFFHLLAASALTVEPAFALVFFAFLVVAPCALVLALLRREVQAAGGTRRLAEESFVEPSLFRSLATMTVVLFVSTLVVFIVFPRMGAGYFASPLGGGAVLAGFSEEVGPGSVAALQQDDAVALRVTVDRPDLLAGRIYWRGAALDQFDGRVWKRKPQEARPLVRGGPGVFVSPASARREPFVNEDIILEPIDSATIFFAGRPIEVRGRFVDVAADALGNVRVLRPTGVRTRYQISASLAPRRTQPTAESSALPTIDPRIIALARDRTRAARDDVSRVEALLDYFRHGFRYTLSPGDPGTADPLVRFLFETRSGHCEYFASAFAVMLRAIGIPALVVNGYAGGEWNPYGNYFVVRQRDAHSWVEAYVAGEWRTFDPTPPGEALERGLSSRVADMVDAAQMRWYRYVVNYTLEDQAEAALSLRDASRRLWDELRGDWWKRSDETEAVGEARSRSAAPWLAAIVVAAFVAWLWTRRVGRGRRDAEDVLSDASRQYARLLRALEAIGFDKQPGETASEFCRRVGAVLPLEPEHLARVTSLYEEARFSGRDVDADVLDREVSGMLARLGERSGGVPPAAPGP